MSKRNMIRERKKARSTDGIVFSRIGMPYSKAIKVLTKQYGYRVFENPDHEYWHYMRRRNIELRAGMGSDMRTLMALSDCDVYITRKIGKKGYHSIYVDSLAVADFIEQSEPKASDGNLIKQASKDANEMSSGEGLAIHLPGRKDSIFVSGGPSVSEDYDWVVYHACGGNIGFMPLSKDGEWEEDPNQDPSDKEENDRVWRVICNLFLYMDAFPDCVIEGPPQFSSGVADGKKQSRVFASPSIEDIYHQAKSTPHMRRGHFRVLKSERYTKKRFQSVFVRPAMVGGSASTVIDALYKS